MTHKSLNNPHLYLGLMNGNESFVIDKNKNDMRVTYRRRPVLVGRVQKPAPAPAVDDRPGHLLPAALPDVPARPSALVPRETVLGREDAHPVAVVRLHDRHGDPGLAHGRGLLPRRRVQRLL